MGRDFRGGGRGGFRGRGGDRGGGRGRGFGGRGGGGYRQEQGPPQRVEQIGTFSHVCGNQIVVSVLPGATVVPKFFRQVYFENMTPIGKIDEILGPVDSYFFSVDLNEGVVPSSFKVGQQIFLDPYDTLTLDRFTNPQKRGGGGGRGAPRGGPGRGGPRGRGPPRGGRGGPRGFSRGPPRGRGGYNR